MSNTKTQFLQMAMIVLCALLVVLILPLIGNIHDIKFLTGREAEFSGTSSSGGMPPVSPGWSAFSMMLRVMFVLALIVLVYQMIVNRSFRRLYLVLMVIFFGFLIASDLLDWEQRDVEDPQPVIQEDDWVQPIEQDSNVQPVERDVAASGAQIVILAIILSSAVVIAGSLALYKWLKSRPVAEDDGYNEILGSITHAARRLRAGEDPRTVVLFCYQEMIFILSTKGKIDATYLTPREFETRLRSLGLSGESIKELTAIFEIVRYAGRVDDGFAARALAALDAIQETYGTDEQ